MLPSIARLLYGITSTESETPLTEVDRGSVIDALRGFKKKGVYDRLGYGTWTDLPGSLIEVNRIKERAGLPKDFRALHGLRHVYASMLASSGQVDMFTLQKLLTHKSPQMTQRYAHLRDESLRRASNLAGDIITQAMNGAEAPAGKMANLTDRKR